MAARSHLIADGPAVARLEAIARFLLRQSQQEAFLIEDSLTPDKRGRFAYNLPVIVNFSVRSLLDALEAQTAAAATIQAVMDEYEAHPRHMDDLAHVRLSDGVVVRLDAIYKHLKRMDIKPLTRNRHRVINRQALLHIAVNYAYQVVVKE